MNMYVVVHSHSATNLVLRGYLVPSGVLGEYADFFGYIVSTIEANTTIFTINADSVSDSNPILAKMYPDGSTFWSMSETYVELEDDFYLNYWKYQKLTFPIDAVPGVEYFTLWAEWFYSTIPPTYPQDYMYTGQQAEYDAGDGQKYKSSCPYSSAQPFDLDLLYVYYDYGEELKKYTMMDYNLWLHELGGSPDWSDFIADSSGNPNYAMYAEATPPAVPSYTGNNVWNISEEFSDNIEIIDTQYVYQLYLNNCTWNPKTTVVEDAPPDTTPTPGALGILIGLDLMCAGFHLSPEIIAWTPWRALLHAKKLDYLLGDSTTGLLGDSTTGLLGKDF